MITKDSLFAQIAPQSVQPLRTMPVDDIRAAALANEDRFRAIDCKDCGTRNEVLAHIARALRLPDYFGANLDALYDALTDLPHAPTQGWIIVLQGLPLLPDMLADDREALLDVFKDAAEFHAQEQTMFRVFYSYA